jgi:hypothetical protein
MAKAKEIKWALFDADNVFKGGIITLEDETPTNTGQNPEGYREEQVTKFPGPHDSWDAAKRVWVTDKNAERQALAKLARSEKLNKGSRADLADNVMEDVQTWFLGAVAELFPDVHANLSEEDVKRIFPAARR